MHFIPSVPLLLAHLGRFERLSEITSSTAPIGLWRPSELTRTGRRVEWSPTAKITARWVETVVSIVRRVERSSWTARRAELPFLTAGWSHLPSHRSTTAEAVAWRVELIHGWPELVWRCEVVWKVPAGAIEWGERPSAADGTSLVEAGRRRIGELLQNAFGHLRSRAEVILQSDLQPGVLIDLSALRQQLLFHVQELLLVLPVSVSVGVVCVRLLPLLEANFPFGEFRFECALLLT